MTTGQKSVTAEELLYTPDDGLRRELVRGEVRTMAPAGNVHGRVAINIGAALATHVRQHDLGTVFATGTGFKIASHPDTVRAPDAAFVRRERVEAIGEVEGYWPGAPDLAVEVVSPSDKFSEVEEKIEDWLGAGARMVLVVDPRGRNVTVRLPERRVAILTEGESLDGGDVVPGWILSVSDVFL